MFVIKGEHFLTYHSSVGGQTWSESAGLLSSSGLWRQLRVEGGMEKMKELEYDSSAIGVLASSQSELDKRFSGIVRAGCRLWSIWRLFRAYRTTAMVVNGQRRGKEILARGRDG